METVPARCTIMAAGETDGVQQLLTQQQFHGHWHAGRGTQVVVPSCCCNVTAGHLMISTGSSSVGVRTFWKSHMIMMSATGGTQTCAPDGERDTQAQHSQFQLLRGCMGKHLGRQGPEGATHSCISSHMSHTSIKRLHTDPAWA